MIHHLFVEIKLRFGFLARGAAGCFSTATGWQLPWAWQYARSGPIPDTKTAQKIIQRIYLVIIAGNLDYNESADTSTMLALKISTIWMISLLVVELAFTLIKASSRATMSSSVISDTLTTSITLASCFLTCQP